MDPQAGWWILAALLVMAGVAGTVLPAVPGIPLVFGGLLLAAWIDGFHKVGWMALGVLAFLTLISFWLDFLASALGARRAGASWRAVMGAGIGTGIGLFFGLPGLILGPFVGAVLGELSARPDPARAVRAGFGTWLGLLIGTLAKLALAFLMIGIFLGAYFFF